MSHTPICSKPDVNGIGADIKNNINSNTANNNAVAGIEGNCPSSVVQNTAKGNATNLVLNGPGCTNKNNVTD